VNLDYFFM